ncbi:MAG: hypothetical protein ACE5M4_02245 [Anaerolineales bacterium]
MERFRVDFDRLNAWRRDYRLSFLRTAAAAVVGAGTAVGLGVGAVPQLVTITAAIMPSTIGKRFILGFPVATANSTPRS